MTEDRITRAVLDAVPDAIGLFDANGEVLLENAEMARLRPAFEAAGWAPPFDDRRAHQDGDERRPWSSLEFAGDRKRHFRRYVAEVPGQGTLVVLHDATIEYEAEQAKDDFFALVSHELQTPLTSIVGFVDLARGEGSDEARERHLEIAARNATRLQTLVNDLLFLSRAGAGRIELAYEPLDLAELVAEAVESARPRADAEQISVAVEAQRTQLQADRRRVLQIVDNLISNAIKFTPAGGDVSVRTFADGRSAVLEVSDTGPGVVANEHELLFERFYRSPATAKRVPGAGLGLTVANVIVELHEGSIDVESREGDGTTFRVALPAEGAVSR